MTAWAIDLDGVMWRGSEAIAGSADAVGRLRAAGHPVVFVTNSSVRTPAQVAGKLAGHGIPDAEKLVVTSALAAAHLVQADERVLVLGGDGIRAAVTDRRARLVPDDTNDGEEVDVVVVGLDHSFDYDRLSRAMAAIRAGARFVATNDDASFPVAGGRLLPGAGSLVRAVETASGAGPEVAGKPHEAMARTVRQLLGDDDGGDGIMVGDRTETDGRFAATLGFRYGLVLTGVTGRDDLPVEPAPDVVAADLAELVERELG